jgi:aminoglycoside phosphotransferase family enzyme
MPSRQTTLDRADVPLADKLEWLKRTECYPVESGHIEVIETHFAWLFLTPRFVYKLKKPVNLPRMNFADLGARHYNCHEEVRLNRRLAGDVYLGVVPLVRCGKAQLLLERQGEVVEWLVKMVRLDASLMLNARLRAPDFEAREVRPAFEHLARFYRNQPRTALSPTLYRRRLEAQVEGNRSALLDTALTLEAGAVREITALQLQFLGSHHRLVVARAQRRQILEGHGDLRPEHVYLGLPPAFIDCLEFDRDLRILDPAEELAFFSIECARLDVPSMGSLALEIYREICEDDIDRHLYQFYLSHRAMTRAKIVIWHLLDPEYRDRGPWRVHAMDYLARARVAAERALDA